MNRFKKVVIHGGVFHADDVAVVALLQSAGYTLPVERKFKVSEEELADPAILVADIGGNHNPALNNFDHHQDKNMQAACVLFYDSFVLEDTGNELEGNREVFEKFKKDFLEPISDADCGRGNGGDLSFSKVVVLFNPGPEASEETRMAAFDEAVAFMLKAMEKSMARCKEIVESKRAVLDADTAVNGKVLVLDKFVPWDEHVYSRPDQEDLLYVIFPSLRGGFCIQQVPVEAGSFEGRKPLPEEWAGKRGDDLKELVGLDESGSATFCHPGRFICGAETLEDALKLAELAVKS